MNHKILFLTGCSLFLLLACQQAESPDLAANNHSQDAQEFSDDVSAEVVNEQVVAVDISMPAGYPSGQLPRTVLPKHYTVALRVDPAVDRFSGQVQIKVEVTEPQNEIWLHGLNLNVTSASLQGSTGEITLSYEQVDEYGVSRLKADRQIPAGNATLAIHYDAPFNHSLEGLYRVDSAGKAYAFTQFEASSARLAFPSFDDPGFKTPFDVSIEVKDSDTAITNGPQISTSASDEGWQKLVFATTKPLPTYLVAFAVGPLDVVQWQDLPATAVRQRPLALGGIAVAGKGEQLDYALENSEAILAALEDYFGIEYPYAKLDIIAVPDFAAGAMENAGAITYREPLLLLDENATAQQRYSYAAVHAHELAHQWFGNLVTPVWWDDIWLNEAFATWMASVTLDSLDPAGGYRRTLTKRALSAMNVDSLTSARQIRQPIASNHDIASAFDAITYSKGGGVLAMFERYMGRERFRSGIQNYMREHAWGNATADDFIAAIAAAAGEAQTATIDASFKSFLNQPGVPFLNTAVQCENQTVSLAIKQSRYLPLGISGDTERNWQLPVCIRYAVDGEVHSECTLLEQPQQTIALQTTACPDWVLPNADGAGYFRFSLADGQWQQLLSNTEMLNTSEMLVAVDSYLAAYKSGSLGVESLMQQLPQLIAHPDVEVASSVLADYKEIYTEIANSFTQKVIRDLTLPVLRERLDQLGMEQLDDRNAASLQAALVRILAFTLQDNALRAELSALGQSYTGNDTLQATRTDADVNQSIISHAVAVAIQEQGKYYFDHVVEKVLASEDAQFRQRMLAALARTNNADLARQVRDLALDSRIRNNETPTILYTHMNNVERRDAAWDWLIDQHEAIIERIPIWRKGRIASYASVYCDADKAEAANAFFGPKVDALQGGPRALAAAKESISQCVARKAHYQAQMTDWAIARNNG